MHDDENDEDEDVYVVFVEKILFMAALMPIYQSVITRKTQHLRGGAEGRPEMMRLLTGLVVISGLNHSLRGGVNEGGGEDADNDGGLG